VELYNSRYLQITLGPWLNPVKKVLILFSKSIGDKDISHVCDSRRPISRSLITTWSLHTASDWTAWTLGESNNNSLNFSIMRVRSRKAEPGFLRDGGASHDTNLWTTRKRSNYSLPINHIIRYHCHCQCQIDSPDFSR